jgi:23S rRNA (adenine2503-C2)-methyltransferase
MKILKTFGREDLAMVYLAELENGRMIEFVESLQPPYTRDEKWVLIVSSLYGCPIGCKMCDASLLYGGKISESDILSQIDHLVVNRFPERVIPIPKFKIQFARMGEPSLNTDVLTVLEKLPHLYDAPGLIPCISTVAPEGTDEFFHRLIDVKNTFYPKGKFQMQFSIHTTDEEMRNYLIPVKKWGLERISEYGEQFYREGDRKITINFAVTKEFPVEPEVVAHHFNKEKFVVKITPLNPTSSVEENKLESLFNSEDEIARDLVQSFKRVGFDVILSIGELEENRIGSNCGQYVSRYLDKQKTDVRDQKTETTARSKE